MRSMDLDEFTDLMKDEQFLWIRLIISSLSAGGHKNEFSTVAPRKFNGDIFEWGILRSRLEATFEK